MRKIFLAVLFLFLADIGRYFFLPDISSLRSINPKTTAYIEYKKKEWQSQGRNIDIQKEWVSFYNISPNIINAVLIGEDDKFWKHNGFDGDGIKNAAIRSFEGKLSGGSTITQQTAKNLYLTPTKNPTRKIKEAILTFRMENTLSKEKILEIYLNSAEWGDGIFGIEAAAKHYYHKSASKLTMREAARLASVLPNPIKYDPLGKQEYVDNRSKTILKVLKKRRKYKK